jgi:hypothetical protein
MMVLHALAKDYLDVHTLSENFVVADQLLTILAISSDGPGAASFLMSLRAAWKLVNVSGILEFSCMGRSSSGFSG